MHDLADNLVRNEIEAFRVDRIFYVNSLMRSAYPRQTPIKTELNRKLAFPRGGIRAKVKGKSINFAISDTRSRSSQSAADTNEMTIEHP